jgi:hypothetical protein
MDQTSLSQIKKSRCCAGINNPRCRRDNLRNLTLKVIEKIHSMGYNHELDETMRICLSCLTAIQHNRSVPNKKRRTIDEPSTSDANEDDIQGKEICRNYKIYKLTNFAVNVPLN